MDRDSYSTYDAKTRFSELLRKVRSGRSVTITYRGEPVAEVRPLERPGSTEARIDRLADQGMVTRRPEPPPITPVAHRSGALERFLDERDEA